MMNLRLQVMGGQFQLISRINTSPSAIVYNARDTVTGNLVAVKRNMRRTDTSMINQDNVLRHVGHLIYFPTFIRTFMEANQMFLVMSKEGRNLKSIADQSTEKKLSKVNLIVFIFHASIAIRTLHDSGFIHRAINPETFVVGRRNQKAQIVLLGFRRAQRIQQNNSQMDSPEDNVMNTTVGDWICLAHSFMCLAGYREQSDQILHWTSYGTPDFNVDLHAYLPNVFSQNDKWMVAIVELLYTAQTNFNPRSVQRLVEAEPEFNREDVIAIPDPPVIVIDD